MSEQAPEEKKMSSIVPAIDLHAERQLLRAANETALRFMAPVYLCGSAMTSGSPLDLDIFLVVAEKQFRRLIGCSSEELQRKMLFEKPDDQNFLRLARFYKKQKQYFESFVYSLDIDFKVKTFDQFFSIEVPRRRLDALGVIGIGEGG